MNDCPVRLSALVGLMVALTSTNAVAADPDINVRWPLAVGTKSVYIHSAMPPLCDNAVLYSVNTWNQVGAKFAYTWPSNPITAYRRAEQSEASDLATVTVEDGPIPQDPDALMATRTVTGSDGYLKNADITVRTSLLFYGDAGTGAFFCAPGTTELPPSNKYDYRSAMLHELGHALGFQLYGEYYDVYACIMYAYLDYGQVRRSTCTGEYNRFRAVYGVR